MPDVRTRKDRAREYLAWSDMKWRCKSRNPVQWRIYGSRGITVCERWLNSFEAFLSDMGPAPSRKHTLERIDNCKGYEPGNCRWATWAEQCDNRRTTKLRVSDRAKVLRMAEKQTQIEIARELGVSQPFISRILSGKRLQSAS